MHRKKALTKETIFFSVLSVFYIPYLWLSLFEISAPGKFLLFFGFSLANTVQDLPEGQHMSNEDVLARLILD